MKSYLLTFFSFLSVIVGSSAQVALPYSSDFEVDDGFVLNTPLGSNWLANGDFIAVTNERSHLGSQSIRISRNVPENVLSLPENVLSLPVNLMNESILFLDYHIQFVASELPDLLLSTTLGATSLLMLESYGTGARWMFLDGDGLGSGVWFSAGETILLDELTPNRWHRITLRLDLISKTWDVYIDEILLAADIGFAEAPLTNSDTISIYGSSAGDSYVDTFSIKASNPLFPDVDLDGIDDRDELDYGLDSSIDDRDLDPDDDGVTNIEEYINGTHPLISNIVNIDLPANGNLTEIKEVSGNLEIINDGTLLFNGPLNEVYGLNIVGTENSGDINIMVDGMLNGFFNVEGDVGTITFNSTLTVITDLSILDANTVIIDGLVNVEGTTTIDVLKDITIGVLGGIYPSSSFNGKGDVTLTTVTDLTLTSGSINVTGGNLSATVGGNLILDRDSDSSLDTSSIDVTDGDLSAAVAGSLILDRDSSLNTSNGSLNGTIGGDFTVLRGSNISVSTGSATFNVTGAIRVDSGSQMAVDNPPSAFGTMQLYSSGTITVSDNSTIDINYTYMVLYAPRAISLTDSSQLNITTSYAVISTPMDLTLVDSEVSASDDGFLSLQLGRSLWIVRCMMDLKNSSARWIVGASATIEGNSKLTFKDGNLSAEINGDLTLKDSSEVVVTDGSMDLDVNGSTMIKRESRLEVQNTAATGTGNSLELMVDGSLTFDSSMLAVRSADLNILSSGELSVHSSSLTVSDGDSFIRSRANLNLVDSVLSTNGGILLVSVAQSTYTTDSDIMVHRGSFYLNMVGDIIMDADSLLRITGASDLYANIFGKADLGGKLELSRLFSMYVRGNATLGTTGLLDALIIVLETDANIFINGRMDTNVVTGGTYLTAEQGSIYMNSMDPISSYGLTAISGTGVFLRTEVKKLTAQALTMDISEIEIHEVDDVTLKTVYNANGAVQIIAGGTLTAEQVFSATDAPDNNIRLMSTGGDLEVGFVLARKTHGEVLLSARGSIKEMSDYDVGFDVIGNKANIYAGGSIASDEMALDIDVNELNELEEVDMSFVTFALDGKGKRTGGGELVQTVLAGDMVVAPEVTSNTEWAFTGWDIPFDVVDDDLTVTAQYETTTPYYSVTFQLVDGLNLVRGDLIQEIPEGSAAVAPQLVADPGYQFIGWDVSFDAVTSDLLVTAQIGTDSVKLHKGVISNVSDSWQTVNLPYTYNSMVAVCTVSLQSASSLPVVPRVRNAFGNSFEIKLQNPNGADLGASYTVHYLVMEEGQYTLANNGVQMEAVKFAPSTTDSKSSWVGEPRSYLNSYSNPVVLGQVMTANDDDWSVFWAMGDTRTDPPLSTAFSIGKHVGEDTPTIRADETLGYIVIESGSGTIGSYEYEAGLGSARIRGIENSPPYIYNVQLPETDTVVLSAAAMNGQNGGWPVLYGENALENSRINLAFDKYQNEISGRLHSNEQVAYFVLSGDTIEPNSPPDIVLPIADITVEVNSPDTVIPLHSVFADLETADEDLTFTVVSDNVSLVTAAIDTINGELNLSYTPDSTGSATIMVTAEDSDVLNPLSVSDSFLVTVLPTYTVIFELDGKGMRTGGGELEQTVPAGGEAIAPEVEGISGWIFTGWDVAFDSVVSDLTVTAQYDSYFGDFDGDGFNNMDEYRLNTNSQTNNPDSDTDGIPDEIENLYAALDPTFAADALKDYDNDGIPSIFEVYNGSDPDDPESTPVFDEGTIAYFKVDQLQNETYAFDTITEAEMNARNFNYSIIEVLPGDYAENVSLSSSTLLIAPQGPEGTILRSTDSEEEALTILGLCVLDGFTIRYDQGPAIDTDSPERIVIRNCSIASEGIDLQFTFGGGISKSGGIVDIVNCYMSEAGN